MVVGTAPASKRQVLPTDLYYGLLVQDDIAEYDDVDFETRAIKGKVWKYTADLEIDGVEDEFSPGRCFVKRLFFTLSSHEKASLPKFLRAIGIPMDDDCNFDTSPAVGKAWVALDVVKKKSMTGGWTNKVESYTRARAPHEGPPSFVRAATAVGWDDETPVDETEVPF